MTAATSHLQKATPRQIFNCPAPEERPLARRAERRETGSLFLSKDDTSGCTKEAMEFNALREKFAKAGATIIGLSPDSVKSHDKFRANTSLRFRSPRTRPRRP